MIGLARRTEPSTRLFLKLVFDCIEADCCSQRLKISACFKLYKSFTISLQEFAIYELFSRFFVEKFSGMLLNLTVLHSCQLSEDIVGITRNSKESRIADRNIHNLQGHDSEQRWLHGCSVGVASWRRRAGVAGLRSTTQEKLCASSSHIIVA